MRITGGDTPLADSIFGCPQGMMWTVAQRQSPTVKRRRLALTLRQLRGRAGLSASDAARRVDHDSSWLSRIENAEVRPHPNDVRALLDLYGVTGEQAEAVIAVARQAKQRGWWQRYGDAVPDWFASYVGMESEASVIRSYQCQMVPGLLQTEDYARAAFQGAPVPMRDDEVERQVSLRMERQAILTSDAPPMLRMVVDEAAVRRLVGGAEVIRGQIAHLTGDRAARATSRSSYCPTRQASGTTAASSSSTSRLCLRRTPTRPTTAWSTSTP